MERWLKITESDNYEVSDLGRVRNNNTGKILLCSPNSHGYSQVSLKGKVCRIHRLVATYFLDNPNKYGDINHKDGNKLNNQYTNLEWCTRSFNLIHAYQNNLRTPSHMKRVAKCTLSWEILEEYESVSEAARANNLSISNVQTVVTQRMDRGRSIRKTAGGYRWKFIF